MQLNRQYLFDLLVDEFRYEPISPMLLIRAAVRGQRILEEWMNTGVIERHPYVVVCDGSNNPRESLNQGILNIDIRLPEWYEIQLHIDRDTEAVSYGPNDTGKPRTIAG